MLNYLAGRVAGGISEACQNLLINAIRFYYEQVEGQPRQYYEVPRPKRPLQNPKLLAKEEVKALLLGTDNLKHRAMLMLAYGLGLRLGEVLALTPSDIDSKRMAHYVRGGKGKKDRCPCPTPCCTCCASSSGSSGPPPFCLRERSRVNPTAPAACNKW